MGQRRRAQATFCRPAWTLPEHSYINTQTARVKSKLVLFATVGGNKQQIMYRYCVDNAVTYTSEDFALFRESPFAAWMERLTLENPDHGIPPDVGSQPPGNPIQRQDDLADTLQAEEKNVCLVDWDDEEPARRSATLQAMRSRVDFIVNGQLALGPLSGSANLLMRTSGYSELGNYLYIPCDTQDKTTLDSAFRLCFLADLLHSLQGQLPPQMLIIRGGTDLVPLQTEDHIYHYRAVKHRFMETMRSFRKHRMPDPVDSSHFGRWSDCANEVMKQRAIRGADEQPLPVREIDHPLPRLAEAGAQAVQAELPGQLHTGGAAAGMRPGLQVSGTLADQARLLHAQTADSGLASSGGAAHSAATPSARTTRASSGAEAALENLEFIGSGFRAPTIGGFQTPPPEHFPAADEATARDRAAPEAPAVAQSESRAVAQGEPPPVAQKESPATSAEPKLVPDTASIASDGGPPGKMSPAIVDSSGSKPHPLDSSGCFAGDAPVVDRDEIAPMPIPLAGLTTDSGEFEVDCIDDSDYGLPGEPQSFAPAETEQPAAKCTEIPVTTRPFSSSLNTAGEFDE